METDSILINIGKHIALDADETLYFTSLLSYKTILKNSVILKEGQTCNYLNYVEAGALRSYCIEKEGKESTIMFAVADWWITDMYCFLNRKPALMFIEAIQDTCLFQLSRDNQEKLYAKIPKFERFFRILMQNAYTREQLRIIENLSLPAEERYQNFLCKYPHIATTVTQKQIAAYLGVTPEFLSTLKNRRSKKSRS